MPIQSQYSLLLPTSHHKHQRSWLGRLWAAFVNLLIFSYVGLFIVYQIVLYSPLGNWWLIRFYDIFGYLLYVPLPLLLIFLFFPTQRKNHALALLIPLLFFAYEYGSAFTPHIPFASAAAAQSDIPLRVMTWNTYFSNVEVSNLVNAIQHEQPDLLALQEFGASYADDLTDALKDTYPYQMLYPSWQPNGFAIFSRYPLQEVLPLHTANTTCRCIQAAITIKDRQITMIVIHPTVPYFDIDFHRRLPRPTSFDTHQQDFQHKSVLQLIAQIETPLLVVGDFNATDRMPMIDAYRATLTDSYREAGWGFGFTFPYEVTFRSLPLPSLVRLDYIFHDESWRANRSWLGQATGSDHRYVVADLLLVDK